MEYRLLSRATHGTFLTIIDVSHPHSHPQLRLKSLAILNFHIQEVDYSHCAVKDTHKENCHKCQEGYLNFRGRCRREDRGCLSHVTDECLRCKNGFELVRGRCLHR